MARPLTHDMVALSRARALYARCWIRVKTPIDYINPHATRRRPATPEIEAIRKVFGTGEKMPADLGDQGTHRSFAGYRRAAADHSLLMMNKGFVCESAHITELDPVFASNSMLDRAQTHRQRQTRHRAVEFLRLRWHQRHAGVQADGCVIFGCSSCPAQAGHPVRRGFAIQSMASLEYCTDRCVAYSSGVRR